MTSFPAAALFWVLFTWWWVSEIVNLHALRAPAGAVVKDRGSRRLVVATYWLGVLGGFGAGIAAPSATIEWGRPVVFASGVALMLGGLALRRWAIVTLGRFHTLSVTALHGHELVDRGPYRAVRHPSYAGSLLIGLGILLCATNWLALAAFPVLAAGHAYRMRVEESVLRAEMGAAYSDYMDRTRALIPKVL